MKIYLKGKLLCSKIMDCIGLMSLMGLRFTSDFGPFDAYLIHMLADSVLDSWFVFQNFTAVWLDKENKVLKVELCKPWRFFGAVNGQQLVLELPISAKVIPRVGDKLVLKE